MNSRYEHPHRTFRAVVDESDLHFNSRTDVCGYARHHPGSHARYHDRSCTRYHDRPNARHRPRPDARHDDRSRARHFPRPDDAWHDSWSNAGHDDRSRARYHDRSSVLRMEYGRYGGGDADITAAYKRCPRLLDLTLGKILGVHCWSPPSAQQRHDAYRSKQ
jgi:hypothetical protein